MRGNPNQIMAKKNLEVEIILEKNLTEEEGIILEKNLTEEVEIILEKNLTEEEGIIMEKDITKVEGMVLEKGLTEEEESQPTKKAVDEVTRIRLLINMEIRAIGTVIGNHRLKDSSF